MSSVTSSLRYAIAIAEIFMRNYQHPPSSIRIAVIDAKKLSKQTHIWYAERVVQELDIDFKFEVTDEYLVFGQVTGPPQQELLPFHQLSYTTIAPIVEAIVPRIRHGRETFSSFWEGIRMQNDPQPEQAKKALEFAQTLCKDAPALWIPLLFHALCLPRFRDRAGDLFTKLIDLAYDSLVESGALRAVFRKIATATCQGAGNVQGPTLDMFDFLGSKSQGSRGPLHLASSTWQPESHEDASEHVLLVYRAIAQLGQTAQKTMEKKLWDMFQLSSYGYLLWTAVKEQRLRDLVTKIDPLPNLPKVFDAVTRSMEMDDSSMEFGRIYMKLKHTFLARQQVSLTWFHEHIQACKSRVLSRSAVSFGVAMSWRPLTSDRLNRAASFGRASYNSHLMSYRVHIDSMHSIPHPSVHRQYRTQQSCVQHRF
jgi:hypothetical protein